MSIQRDGKRPLPLTRVILVLASAYPFVNSTVPAVAEDGPIPVPLIKLEYPGNPPNIRMLYVRLLKLGAKRVNQPLLFDTGSSGVTIDCKVALPSELCSPDGIRIDKDTEVNGIVVTTEKVIAIYGSYTEYGHIAKARLTFGDTARPAETSEAIAVLIRYKKVRNSDGKIVGGPLWPLGIFGVSPLGGIGPNESIRSPIDAVALGGNVHRGYRLDPIGRRWKVCTNERGDCPTTPSLHVGLSDQDKDGYQLWKLTRANPAYNFPTLDTCINWQISKICEPTLFDTANSTIMIGGSVSNEAGASLPKGSKVSVDITNGDTWRFQAEYRPEVEFVHSLDHHIVGIRYFEKNSFLVDLDAGEIGLRLGK
jgi:hypothetical protein